MAAKERWIGGKTSLVYPQMIRIDTILGIWLLIAMQLTGKRQKLDKKLEGI